MSRYLCPSVSRVVVLQSPCVSQGVLWHRVLITACSLQPKMTPQEKLKLRMQKALNKQCESCTLYFTLPLTGCEVILIFKFRFRSCFMAKHLGLKTKVSFLITKVSTACVKLLFGYIQLSACLSFHLAQDISHDEFGVQNQHL